MRRLPAFCPLLALLCANTPAQGEASYAVKQDAAPCLKFRPEPSTSSSPGDCLVPGTHVSVIESDPFWMAGLAGWRSSISSPWNLFQHHPQGRVL